MFEDMIGKYVIVRCRDAGVHAGELVSAEGRSCRLKKSRRLWSWHAADKSCFLSGVANHGLEDDSKIGETLEDLVLTENCEIIVCTPKAEESIRKIKAHAVD